MCAYTTTSNSASEPDPAYTGDVGSVANTPADERTLSRLPHHCGCACTVSVPADASATSTPLERSTTDADATPPLPLNQLAGSDVWLHDATWYADASSTLLTSHTDSSVLYPSSVSRRTTSPDAGSVTITSRLASRSWNAARTSTRSTYASGVRSTARTDCAAPRGTLCGCDRYTSPPIDASTAPLVSGA